MTTKQRFAQMVLNNAEAEAKEILQHAKEVSEFILRHFPDEVPDRFVRGEVRSSESSLLGRLRHSDETGRMMLQRLNRILEGVARDRGGRR
jgi:hypothetical protein